MVWDSLKGPIENCLGESIIHYEKLSGGGIAHAFKARAGSGKAIFAKTLMRDTNDFLTEAHGLQELSKANCVNVPRVLYRDRRLLILEHIPSHTAPSEEHSYQFGRQLARLHRYKNSQYGFFEDNTIGATIQKNLPRSSSWSQFFWQNRLLFQFKLLEQKGLASTELTKAFNRIESSARNLLEDAQSEGASLLHGDLWSGNYLIRDSGEAYLIDPAVYYGHREADMAMTRLFGGFSEHFYRGYEDEYPLLEGHKERLELYQLYHVFNHANIFGASYCNQALSLMRKYG